MNNCANRQPLTSARFCSHISQDRTFCSKVLAQNLKAAKEPHAPMVELAISMGKVDFAAGLKIVQETLKNGKVANGVTLPDNVTLGCEFKSDMALYRFVHVTDTDWQVYVVSAVTRSAALHISSEILEPMCKGKGENGADVSYAVNSPTRARQVCAMCHKAIQDNLETGYASIAYGFRNGKWHNCGGVGTPMPEYQYGKYAKLFSGSAKVWRNLVNKTERLPDKETLQKRLEETG